VTVAVTAASFGMRAKKKFGSVTARAEFLYRAG
jgi:hypothetical protein